MIKIGDFAKIFDVSIKTIRFYEEKGLLNPAYIDIYTGYRYYDENNINEMSGILALKSLGLELKEIKNFDKKLIDQKISDYKSEILKIEQNIEILNSLSVNKEGEVLNMNTFINDAEAIGSWKLIGIANTKEDFINNNLLEDKDYLIKDLYLMKGGQNYWVISWSKGIIRICGRDNPYSIENDLMFVNIKGLFDTSEYKVAVYKKRDSKEYSIDEIRKKDNTNIPFIKDEELVGFWKSVDFVNKIDNFDPIKNNNFYKAIESIMASPNGKITIYYSSGKVINTTYSKNYIIDLILKDTLSKYEYRKINNKIYLFIEWKSGDYIYGGVISGYYVLEKE